VYRCGPQLTAGVGLLGAALLPGVARRKTDHVRRSSTTRRMATRRRPDGRHAPSRQACGHPCWPVVPSALVGTVPACGWGRGGGPGPCSSVAGGVHWPVLAPTRTWGAGVTSPSAGGRLPRGRLATPPAPWLGRRVVPDVEARARVRLPWAGRPAAPCPSRTRPSTGGSPRPLGRPGPGGARRAPPLSLAPCQPRSPKTQRVWRRPTARVVPAWVAEVGHREARAPASGASHPTKACRRRLPASARPSLPLVAAPDARRSA